VPALRVFCGDDQATRGTRLPPAILPLALPLNLVQAVLRARGIIVSPGSLSPAASATHCCRRACRVLPIRSLWMAPNPACAVQANVLTLDATLAPQSTQLLQQLPPVNSSAVQAAFTVSMCLSSIASAVDLRYSFVVTPV
jgi:hypothetical protein